MTNASPQEPTPFWVHCRDCSHEWAPFYIPLAMDERGIALMKSAGKACPRCVGSNVYVGRLPEVKP